MVFFCFIGFLDPNEALIDVIRRELWHVFDIKNPSLLLALFSFINRGTRHIPIRQGIIYIMKGRTQWT